MKAAERYFAPTRSMLGAMFVECLTSNTANKTFGINKHPARCDLSLSQDNPQKTGKKSAPRASNMSSSKGYAKHKLDL
jgi:hypothetical protein